MDKIDIFEFEEDENFEKHCGDIFLTTKGHIAIQCTFCDILYKTFEAYYDHLDGHLCRENFENVEDSNQEQTDDLEYLSEDNEESYVVNESWQKIEEREELERDEDENEYRDCEILQDEALKEVELPISFLKDSTMDTEIRINKKKTVKPFLPKPVEIPKVVRDVNKRKLLRPPTIPDIERKHKCPVCDLAFKDRNNMRQHLKRHSDEKKHACQECFKKFYTPTEVKIHMKSHTSERNFLCSDCGKSYKTNFQLTCHSKRHKNQRDFKCEVCDKSFFDSHTLKDHMIVHSTNRPFVCTICSSNFPRRLALKNHMKLHENKREYKCKLCDAGFNQQAGLLSHMRTSHKNS